MALEEHDREDLLRDGRMMPVRGECLIEGVTVMVGFRRQGQLSLYCGADPVFQFNAGGQLRRVFFDGRRYAAENGSFVELTRTSRGGKVQLVSKPVDAATQSAILSSARDWLWKLRQISSNEATRWRVVQEDGPSLQERLDNWLKRLAPDVKIAATPNA